MPRGTSKLAAAGFGLCLLLLAAELLWSIWSVRSPDPVGADAPPDVFSAARARAELVRLLGDESPHPTGSAANDLVRARLIARLTEIGLTPQVQDTIACSGIWPVCGRVQNVLARIDGAQSSTLALMAHYDSREYAPGAGDDGAAVAALLEIARILHAAPQSTNTVLFVFTDGEEKGLLGAEGFFAQHAYAHDVAAVINVEGSGSAGPALLLRSGPRSGALVNTFRAVARYPVASSFSEELFKRMPNNTDLTVSSRFDKPGVDIAFAGERNHYHTPRDTIANLSTATLQHHGEDVLPLARALANADLSKDAPKFVYTTLAQSVWLAYSPKTGLLIAILAVVALGFATWRRWQGLGHFTAALGITALAIVMIIVLELAVLALADLLAGTRVSWPANPWPWRLIIYSTPIVALALQRPLVRKVGFWNTLLAAWWLWAVCALALAWYLPLASHLLLPAVAVATVVIVVLAFAHPLDRPGFRCSAAVFNALLAGFLMLPLAYMGEVTQGLNAAPVMFVPLAMLAVTLLPLLDRGRVKLARWIASVAALAGIAWVHWAALYSEQLPQHINFTYAVNAASHEAHYLAWSFNPLPAKVETAIAFAKAPSPTPWDEDPSLVAPTSTVERATVAVESSAITGVTHTLRLIPAPMTNSIDVVIPEQAPVSAIRMNGLPVAIGKWESHNGYRVTRFSAPPPSGVTVEIDATPDPIDAFIVDSSNSLPDSARVLTDARGQLGVPVREGDRWVVYRPLRI
jgi:hypothetical protein